MASAIVICFMSLLPLDEGLNRGFFSPLLRGPGAAVGLEGWRTPAPEEREVEHRRLHAEHSSRDTKGHGREETAQRGLRASTRCAFARARRAIGLWPGARGTGARAGTCTGGGRAMGPVRRPHSLL